VARIELLNLHKSFGAVQAVKNLTLNIEDCEFVVLVGPSGCGKTTTLRMIAGFEDATSGEIRSDGRVVNDLEPRDRVEEMLRIVGLAGYGARKPSKLSGGQQQRVALARALVQGPRALLLDEPLSSVDPELRTALRAEIRDLHARLGFTLVLVTHDRDEAALLTSRVVAMGRSPAPEAPPPAG